MDKKTVGLSSAFKGNTAPKSFTKNQINGTKYTIAIAVIVAIIKGKNMKSKKDMKINRVCISLVILNRCVFYFGVYDASYHHDYHR